jgi:hypothetical protein
MQHVEIKLGKATLRLSLDCANEPADPETGAGSGVWTFQRRDVRRRLNGAKFCAIDTTRGREFRRGPLTKALAEENATDDPDEFATSDTDAAIRVLALMAEKRATFDVAYYGDGSAYWPFHDMFGHVLNDAQIDNEPGEDGLRGIRLYVDGEDETRAMVDGARAAIRYRVADLADIVREFCAVESDFLRRFDYESPALARFLSGCAVTLIPERN